jgi:hypothetical protein
VNLIPIWAMVFDSETKAEGREGVVEAELGNLHEAKMG